MCVQIKTWMALVHYVICI